MTERWMTVREAAEQLGVSGMWVRRRITAGLIEASDVAIAGKRPRYRISESALQHYFESQRLPDEGERTGRRWDEPRRRGRVRDG